MAQYHEAAYWRGLDGGAVQCGLCRHECKISSGGLGRCRVRRNIDGRLVTLTYGKLIAAGVDPIEKKPLYHVLPGSRSMSIASVGCNFRCKFCQNWNISQSDAECSRLQRLPQKVSPRQLVNSAAAQKCRSISYTYTEPTVFYEYARDCAAIAHEAGLLNCFVTNGYMSDEAIDGVSDILDATNVDLKAFNTETYRDVMGAELSGVLKSLRHLHAAGIWLEVTTLIVPGMNDSESELSDIAGFIASELSVDTPWHISRYHDDYQYDGRGATDPELLEMAAEIGQRAGLRYVYRGNIGGEGVGDTRCSGCGQIVVRRSYMGLKSIDLDGGNCRFCRQPITGIWS